MKFINNYFWFKNGIVKRQVDEKTQEFFKTNPTEKQLAILDEIFQRIENNFLCILLFYLVLSIIVGILLGQYYAKTGF